MKKGKEHILSIIIGILFVMYLLILCRIILFKNMPLYHFFGTGGLEFRSVNLIPFVSIYDMTISQSMGMSWILKNVVGNMAIFVPFGIFLPILFQKSNKMIIIVGALLSLLFEILQYIFALGSSDIDDIILNTIGTMIGLCIYKAMDKSIHHRVRLLAVSLVVILFLGVIGTATVLITSSDLLKIRPTERIVKNGQVIADLEEDQVAVRGKIKELNQPILTIESFVSSSQEKAEMRNINVLPSTKIILSVCTSEFFFSTLVKETTDYSLLNYDNFISDFNEYSGNPVKIWSDDGENASTVMIIVYN